MPYFIPSTKVAGVENYITLQTGVIGTDYEEKLYFFLPDYVTKVEMKIYGYKPNSWVIEHSHGSHTHGLYANEDGSGKQITGWNSYGHSCKGNWICPTTVGSGNQTVSPAFPNGLRIRINGTNELPSIGNGSSDAESDWIDITSHVNKGGTNYIEHKANTSGCRAIIVIRFS